MDPGKFLWSTLKHSNGLLQRTKKYRHTCFLKSALQNYSTKTAQAHEIIQKEKIQLTKPSVVKWKRPPFVKNFFCGKFDTELMAFPEILQNEELAELEGHVKNINELMGQKVNSAEIDVKQKIPDDILQDFKDMGLFGRTIPAKYGGLDLTYTASTRLGEVLGLDWSISSTLIAHEFFATQAVLHFGSEELKSKYLPKLASGEIIAALCCAEVESGSDLISITTTATERSDNIIELNGTKAWVTNADLAGAFIVFAKTVNPVDLTAIDISAFLIERDTEGVFVETMDNMSCLRGLNVGTVHFKEARIPASNVIGQLGHGFPIYLKAQESFRIALNSFTFSTLKAFLDSITSRIIQSERVERSLGDHHLVRCRLAKLSTMIYAMETASYFTAAILDSTENPDVELESAALKLFNSNTTLHCLRELMEIVGAHSLLPGMQLERFYRDAMGLAMCDSPNDVARLFLGLTGCKVVGAKKAEDIKKFRNRFFYPIDAIKRDFRHWTLRRGRQIYDYDIAGHIHPSLVQWGNKLERNLNLFAVAVENTLTRHGKKIVEAEIGPAKLADIAAELYVWSAVLSRSSRSYCIGLRNSHHELRLAAGFCHYAHSRMKYALEDVLVGEINSNQKSDLFLGGHVIDCQGYFAEHPLKHNH